MEKIRSHINNISDSSLWNKLRLGDEEAFSSLFERYYSTLVNYGKKLMTGEDRVKDCVQDVFVDIWTYRYKLNEAIVVKAYLLSSVRKRIARLHHREHIFSNININSFDNSFRTFLGVSTVNSGDRIDVLVVRKYGTLLINL